MEIANISGPTIKQLLQVETAEPLVTMYLPTHRSASPPHMSEDQIRFKNLIHAAVEKLKPNQDRAYQQLSKELCAHLDKLMQDKSFWEEHTEGLLVCAAPGNFQMFHLPVDTEEYVAVDNFYHLAPILGLLEDAHEYYVLVVAQHKPALYKGDMYDLRPTNIKLPESLEAGLNIDEMNLKSEQGRSAGGANNEPARFNGRGGAKNPAEEERLRFFRMIDHEVYEKADRKLPLILAGIESEVVEYRGISNYPKILDEAMQGSFSGMKPHDMYEQAHSIMERAMIDAEHRAAFERFERLRGENPGMTAGDDIATSEAADEGRVDTLFIEMSRFTTDSVRDNMKPTTVLSFPKGEPAKLLQTVARHVWMQGGRIINMASDQFPLGTHMAAICRY